MPSYRDEDVGRQLDLLADGGIYSKGEFRSRFVEAWLVGEGREGFPPSAVNALVKGASTLVPMPEFLEPVGDQGGQATVFRFSRDGQQWALRKVAIDTPGARDHFLETVATLKVLMERVPRGEPGIQYVFDLDAVGFSAQDDMVGVHVYRWIEGHDLHTKLGQLPPMIVADLGMKLARALGLLHRFSIFHRDIRPRNVVLSHVAKDPVLIDFGFAKLADRSGHTRGPVDFSAPEVVSPQPTWSAAADVYALGATCQALLMPGQTRVDLADLLTRMTADNPRDRPDAPEAARLFDVVRSQLQVAGHMDGFSRALVESTEGDRDRSWYRTVVEKFDPTFKAVAFGLHSDSFEVAAELADFLNQVLEAYPVSRNAQRLSLGFVKNENAETGRTFCLPAIESLHQLRVSLSHGDSRNAPAAVKKRLGNPGADHLRDWLIDGGRVIGQHLGVASLNRTLEFVINESKRL